MTGQKNLTPKQEAFAQAYVVGGNASEAYREVYAVAEGTQEKSVWQSASRLLNTPKVISRVKGLQSKVRAQAEERTFTTVESITKELEAARQLAEVNNQPGHMVAAIMAKAKVNGLLVDRKDMTSSDGSMSRGPAYDLSTLSTSALKELSNCKPLE